MIPEWLWSVIVGGVVLGLIAVIRSLDSDRMKDLAKRVKALEDSDKLVAVHEERLNALTKDQQGIRDWKHIVVDPYVPRAIEEHERRLNRMEPRIFNGDER